MINVQIAYNQPHSKSHFIQKIYGDFLKKVKPSGVCLYLRSKEYEKNGRLLIEKSPQIKLEGDVLNFVLNLSLLNFVAWKDNVVHSDEIRLSKLSYTLLKDSFPQENHYYESAMNKHIHQFLAFLFCDFDHKYLKEILNYLFNTPSKISKKEMKLQLEIVSKIDGHEDLRELDIIADILLCFYDKLISVEEFIHRLKNGIDFKILRKSAKKFPELQPFL